MADQPRFKSGPRKGQFMPKSGAKKNSGSRGSKRNDIVHRVKNTMATKINKAVKGAGIVTGIFATIQQATKEDVRFAREESGYWEELGTNQRRAQFVLGRFVNRATGFTIWPDVTREGVGFTFNPGGALNKWTAAGASGILYHFFGRFFNLPQRTRVRNFSWPVFIGGIVGGVLDPPAGQSSHTSVASPRQPFRNVTPGRTSLAVSPVSI